MTLSIELGHLFEANFCGQLTNVVGFTLLLSINSIDGGCYYCTITSNCESRKPVIILLRVYQTFQKIQR